MCGIFGYSGHKNAGSMVVSGLKSLEYRGYDSWGVALARTSPKNGTSKIYLEKHVGKIGELKASKLFPKSTIGIGHTRWATTGAVTKANAHPHFSTDKSFALAQNGIVENYIKLKQKLLLKGYKFISDTDTEVIVRLIEDKLKTAPNLQHAVEAAFKELTGRNTIILLTNTQEIIAVRNGSPLVVGFSDNEIYLSSDTLSFAPFTHKILVVDNGRLVSVRNNTVELFDIKTSKKLSYKTEKINIKADTVNKEGHDHYMLKEINEAPLVLRTLFFQDEKPYKILADEIKKAKNVYTIGSGGAGVAAAQVAYFLRAVGRIKVVALIGADAEEYKKLFTPQDLIIVISQSGETADVLEVIEPAKKTGVKIASFVNMPGSMITRLSDYKFMSESGPEICVMSTKTFVAQIAWGYLLAKAVEGKLSEGKKELNMLAGHIESYLSDPESTQTVKKLAKKLAHEKDIFLLGKQQNFNIMREGMVKIIEAAYIHGHALPSGDLKHYVITLMQKGIPVIVALSNDETKDDVLNSISQVRA
ncbi:MAG: glutamine--fructose-6-phosphate transaminase (isomerizing), partial [Candidatus Levyibacteriota bacterium]